jgi:hypothetical protein
MKKPTLRRTQTPSQAVAKKLPPRLQHLQIRYSPGGRVQVTADGFPALIVAVLLFSLALAHWAR